MWVLYQKEINAFFSTLTGYIVVSVFLVINSLLMWVLPGNYNVLGSQYANLGTLFTLAPWVFLFLVPAVTMRLFAEEKRLGTMETLLTRPMTELELVLAKYLAGLSLVLIALLPTLVYFFSVWQLGNPPGNVDSGGVWGSYIGLFLLAAIYVAVGLFASSLTQNQIIAFIIAAGLMLFLLYGFEAIAGLFRSGFWAAQSIQLGIAHHYASISRGVVDSRDLAYFLAVILIFLFATRTVVQSRNW